MFNCCKNGNEENLVQKQASFSISKAWFLTFFFWFWANLSWTCSSPDYSFAMVCHKHPQTVIFGFKGINQVPIFYAGERHQTYYGLSNTVVSTVKSISLMNSWGETQRRRVISQSQARTVEACGLVLPILYTHRCWKLICSD